MRGEVVVRDAPKGDGGAALSVAACVGSGRGGEGGEVGRRFGARTLPEAGNPARWFAFQLVRPLMIFPFLSAGR